MRVVRIEIDPDAQAAVLPPLLRADGLEDLQEPSGSVTLAMVTIKTCPFSTVDDFPPVDHDRRTSTRVEVMCWRRRPEEGSATGRLDTGVLP